MADLEGQRVGSRRLRDLDDRRLAALVARGHETAFEGLYDRHSRSLLAFCRHLLGDRQDAEDVLQQTFLRAHRALEAGRVPDSVRPWLFTIARNRCHTLLAARRDTVMAPEDLEPACDGLADDARRRAELGELIRDLAALPDDQREALVLFVLGGLSQAAVATVIGCAPGKVKALVFQARETMVADRQARDIPCEEIHAQLDVGRGGVLRRAPLRRHLRQCDPCARYRDSVG
jgi:RNA polymerase sigma factor (sigma-70 family)